MKNVLAAVDLSPVSERVASEAAVMATAFDAKLWLVHVAAPDPDFVGLDTGPDTVREAEARHLHEDHRRLQQLATRLRDVGLDTTALLVRGPTASTILAEARKLSADVLCLGSHGGGRLHEALVGSTTAQVLRKAHVPVLVVPRAPE